MNEKNHLKEFEYWDGEKFITFDMLELTDNKIIVAVTNQGKISVYEYEAFEDENGKYFEYGNTYTRISIDDFEAFDYIED